MSNYPTDPEHRQCGILAGMRIKNGVCTQFSESPDEGEVVVPATGYDDEPEQVGIMSCSRIGRTKEPAMLDDILCIG